MISSDRQHSHVRTVSKRRCPSRLRHSQGINRINSLRRSHAEDLFPLETFVAVDLLPRQLSNFAERIQQLTQSFEILVSAANPRSQASTLIKFNRLSSSIEISSA